MTRANQAYHRSDDLPSHEFPGFRLCALDGCRGPYGLLGGLVELMRALFDQSQVVGLLQPNGSIGLAL